MVTECANRYKRIDERMHKFGCQTAFVFQSRFAEIEITVMRVVLEIMSGPYIGRKVALRAHQQLSVGRTEWSDLALPNDGCLSNKHFAIKCDATTCLVLDLGSSNGTAVNGQRVQQKQVMANGDRIAAGQTTFRIHIECAAPAPQPPEEKSTHKSKADSVVIQVKKMGTSGNRGPISSTISEYGNEREPNANVESSPTMDSRPERADANNLDNSQSTTWVAGALLEIRSGKYAGRKIWVRENQSATIGRSEKANHAIDDDNQMSAVHFAVERGPAGWLVRDLNSSHGTIVNGHLVSQCALAGGERIRAGGTMFTVTIGADDGSATEAANDLFQAGIRDEDPTGAQGGTFRGRLDPATVAADSLPPTSRRNQRRQFRRVAIVGYPRIADGS